MKKKRQHKKQCACVLLRSWQIGQMNKPISKMEYKAFYSRHQQIEKNNIFQNIVQIHYKLLFKSFVNNINCKMSNVYCNKVFFNMKKKSFIILDIHDLNLFCSKIKD
jgi:hypothetical protein